MIAEPERCAWVPAHDPLYVAYHDSEWGVPVRDDQALFERICLEGAQAGLSWITVLRRREHYRRVFDQFDPERIAAYDDDRVALLMSDSGIIRNRLKIQSVIGNARCYLRLCNDYGKFSDYLWSFVDGHTLQNHWRSLTEVPALTSISQRMSADLRKRGFTFVGPTICYAAMQACGLVNDHTIDCFRHAQLAGPAN